MTPAARRIAADQLHDQTLALVRRTAPADHRRLCPGRHRARRPRPAVVAGRLAPGSCCPFCSPDGDLDWAVFTGSLAPGPRGLPNRPDHGSASTAIRSADLVLVPALAVDHAGHRMGRGGGSYDRALARLPLTQRRPMVVALLHDGELLDEVPAEPHDRPVHAVITPTWGLILTPYA